MDILLGVVIIILVSIALLYVGQRFKVPSVVSFLVIGMIVGPYGLSVIQDKTLITMFGELGIILLLFTIGLEFSFEKLLGAWRAVVIGGLLQVCTTIIAIAFITYELGWTFNVAVFFGFLVSLSSTAIVMKVLQERGEIESLPGRTILGILIFQDLAIIPMILITPRLIGDVNTLPGSLPIEVAKVAGILAIIVIMAHWVIPAFLDRVARQRNRELFFITIAGICLLVAWLTNAAGLSLTLGAFIAGLIIGESDYSIDALSNVIPFRDVFAAVFFISIGMLLNTQVVIANFSIILIVILTIIGVKILTGSFAAAVLGMPARVVVFTGLALFQIGEFSFVLAKTGLDSQLIPDTTYQVFLAGAIATMALTPFVMGASPGLMDGVYRLLPARFPSLKRPRPLEQEGGEALSGHLIIAGFGVTGKSVARAAEIAGIPYTIIELDPDTVLDEKNMREERIFFGDAAHPEILEHAGIHRAKALIIVISERAALPRIIRLARQLAPDIYIIARTRFINDVKELLEIGADEVIPEEFETSIEIFSRVLMRYGISDDEIAKFVTRIRSRGYQLFVRSKKPDQPLSDQEMELADLHIHTLHVKKGAQVSGKKLEELDYIKKSRLTVLAIRRNGIITGIPPGDTHIVEGDQLVVFGKDEDIQDVAALFSGDPVML